VGCDEGVAQLVLLESAFKKNFFTSSI